MNPMLCAHRAAQEVDALEEAGQQEEADRLANSRIEGQLRAVQVCTTKILKHFK